MKTIKLHAKGKINAVGKLTGSLPQMRISDMHPAKRRILETMEPAHKLMAKVGGMEMEGLRKVYDRLKKR